MLIAQFFLVILKLVLVDLEEDGVVTPSPSLKSPLRFLLTLASHDQSFFFAGLTHIVVGYAITAAIYTEISRNFFRFLVII